MLGMVDSVNESDLERAVKMMMLAIIALVGEIPSVPTLSMQPNRCHRLCCLVQTCMPRDCMT